MRLNSKGNNNDNDNNNNNNNKNKNKNKNNNENKKENFATVKSSLATDLLETPMIIVVTVNKRLLTNKNAFSMV